MSVAGELLKSRIDHVPVDFRKVGFWSKYTPLSLASRKVSCPDPICRILHNSAWGTGASQNALDAAGRIDNPILLPVGSENGLRLDSQKLCHEVLANRQP
jgi:hypothetical protein